MNFKKSNLSSISSLQYNHIGLFSYIRYKGFIIENLKKKIAKIKIIYL